MTFPNTRLGLLQLQKQMEDGPTVCKGGHTKVVPGRSLMHPLNHIEFGDLSDFFEIVSHPVPAV